VRPSAVVLGREELDARPFADALHEAALRRVLVRVARRARQAELRAQRDRTGQRALSRTSAREEESEGRTRWAGEQAVAAAAASLGANARCGLVANGLGEPEADSSLQAETEELALRASRDGVSDLAADEEGPADGTHEIE